MDFIIMFGAKPKKVAGMENALKHADRRELLGREMNRQKLCCPACGNRQVQLLAYINTKPANWKCRGCGKKFVWEPSRT